MIGYCFDFFSLSLDMGTMGLDIEAASIKLKLVALESEALIFTRESAVNSM